MEKLHRFRVLLWCGMQIVVVLVRYVKWTIPRDECWNELHICYFSTLIPKRVYFGIQFEWARFSNGISSINKYVRCDAMYVECLDEIILDFLFSIFS